MIEKTAWDCAGGGGQHDRWREEVQRETTEAPDAEAQQIEQKAKRDEPNVGGAATLVYEDQDSGQIKNGDDQQQSNAIDELNHKKPDAASEVSEVGGRKSFFSRAQAVRRRPPPPRAAA